MWTSKKQVNINTSPKRWEPQLELADVKPETCPDLNKYQYVLRQYSKYVVYNLLLRGEWVFVLSLFRLSRWDQDLLFEGERYISREK